MNAKISELPTNSRDTFPGDSVISRIMASMAKQASPIYSF
jgi:hypothetical protein